MSADMDTLTPVLTDNWGDDRAWTLASYAARGGYAALDKALGDGARRRHQRGQGVRPARPWRRGLPHRHEVGLHPAGQPEAEVPRRQRRRVGAGHLQGHPADDGQPAHAGRGRHHQLLRDPRQQGVHLHPRRGAPRRYAACSARSRRPTSPATSAQDIHGSGFDLDVVVHAGAGAYICGEETALLEGLEGRRGQPRLRPPFPAVAGLYASPTVINNVESIASVPSIIEHGHGWFASMGTEKSKGYGIFSLSGHVQKPGPVRSPARHHPAHPDRPRRRHPRGPRPEVLDARWLEHPAAHGRAPRHAPRLRGRRRGRLDARHPRAADLRRDHLRGPRDAAVDRVLQARVLRQVHPVPRGHLVAGADAHRAREGAGHRGRPRPAARPVRQHPGPLVLRAGRRCGQPDHRARSSTSATSTSRHLTERRVSVRPGPVDRLGTDRRSTA